MARRDADTLIRQPRRPTHKKQARRKTVLAFCVLLAVFTVAGTVLAVRYAHYRAAQDEYAAYQAMRAEATTPPETEAPAPTAPPNVTATPTPSAAPTAKPFYSAKVARLQKDNRDAVGWLDIVGTNMQYPIVQSRDNEYYMTHTFNKKRNASGAIFMDCWNAPDFSNFNTVIYGHNMQDGSMFAGLREYSKQKFFDEHSIIEITLLNRQLRYRVFAAYTAHEDADFRGQGCATEAQWAAFIRAARKRSTEIDSSATVSRYDKLLTLVTCTSGTHPWYFVVHAVLVEEVY